MSSAQSDKASLVASERRLVAASFLIFLGFQTTYFVGIIGLVTYELGANAYIVSAMVVILNLVLVAAGGVAGVIVDRIGPRITIAASCALMAIEGFLPLALPMGYPLLLTLAVLDGVVAGVGGAAREAYPRFLTDDARELLKTNSWINTASNLSVIVGPTLGGAITHFTGTSLSVFFAMPLVAVPAAIIVWLTPELLDLSAVRTDEQSRREEARGGFWHELAAGVRATFSSKTLAEIFLIYFLGFFAYGAFDSLESIFYRDVLKVGNEWMGWLSACAGIGATAGSLLVLRVPTRKLSVRMIAALLLVTGIGSMIYVGTSSVAVAVVGQLITGLGFGAMPPVKNTLVQRDCDPSAIGRVTSVMQVGANSAGTLPLLVAPFIADAFGVQQTLFAASALVALIAAVFVWISGRGGKRA
ncbi:MAG: MFS transporter [Tractidigestivibacter sp.]|jgi:MFS family permease|uniref:MFS transporter n=1 Tax=Tractidigestivibacter sp. TaxID=2847320 RepID=UPI003D90C0EC